MGGVVEPRGPAVPTHVVATAGHVDHGKSTLVHALTGMQPDRWAEERRRGLTIDLGFAWTDLAGHRLAFVDVPGHERFVPNMLAGVGPVPAVLFVVAADEGWMAQSDEHLAALDAFGVRHGLLAVTKCDRADPAPARAEALARIARTSIGPVPAVAVSGRTGAGLDELRAEVAALGARLPEPDRGADVRLWVDRAFTVRGAGTVVTGTLAAGTVAVGDELELGGNRVRVRGLQTLGAAADRVGAVARVAVNLRGVERDAVGRGDALHTPGAWRPTGEVDVRLRGTPPADLPTQLVLHLGSASVPVRVRPLGTDTARLTLRVALPLRAGDTGLLRDPGAHRIAAGVDVLDVAPPPLRRRGAAAARAAELADPAAAFLRHHGAVPAEELRVLGLAPRGALVDGWHVDEVWWAAVPARAVAAVTAWRAEHPLADGMPAEALRRRLDVPARLLAAALRPTGLSLSDGLVRAPGSRALPSEVDTAVRAVERRLADHPFHAPAAGDLAALGLGERELAAAARLGRLTVLPGGVVLPPDAAERAARIAAALPQPFPLSALRQALDTTRRVAVPLAEHLDARGHTERLADGTRRARI